MNSRKVAGLVPYNKEKKVLLQLRGDDAPINPGYWSSFGGGLEGDETPEEAMRRELVEEIEYRPISPRLFSVDDYVTEGVSLTEYAFIEEFDESQKLILHEGAAYKWFTIPESLNLKITEYRRMALIRLGEFLKTL